MTNPIRVFIGTDPSQLGAAEVLRQSIFETTKRPVEVTTMEKVSIPQPKDIRQSQRTGFSFARWAIPELCNFSGRAIYLDADMLVFTDIAELWDMPMNGATISIVDGRDSSYCSNKVKCNKNETSVMVLDCEKVKWTLGALVEGLGVRYQYKDMMTDLCFLEENDISRAVPRRWNAMDYCDSTVSLLHYTNVPTQPWVSSDNPFGYVWVNALKRMVREGKVSEAYVEEQIGKGYFRPSLLNEMRGETNADIASAYAQSLREIDRKAGYIPHRDLMDFTNKRERAICAYELELARKEGVKSYLKLASRYALSDVKKTARKILRRA